MDGHAGSTEMTTLLTVAIGSGLFVGYPQVLVERGGEAAWLLTLLALGPALLGWWATSRLLAAYPGRALPYIFEDSLGPWAGGAVMVTLLALWWCLLGLALREFVDVVATVILPTTPVSVIAAVLLALSVYAAYWGIEVIARTAWLIVPWLAVALALLLAGTSHWWDSRNLLPLLGPGPAALVGGGLRSVGFYSEVALLGLLAPRLRRQSDVARTGFRALLSAAVLALAIMLTHQLVWPLPAAERVTFPLVKLARLLWVSRFVQRLEAVYVFIWLAVGVLTGAAALCALAQALAQWLRLPQFRPLLFPQAVLVFALVFGPERLLQVRGFDLNGVLLALPVLVFGLPLLLWPLTVWRRRRGRAHA